MSFEKSLENLNLCNNTTNFNSYQQALSYCNFSEEINKEIIALNNSHVSTQFHKEPLLEHLFECGKKCKAISNLFGIDPDIAFWVGFLHDIGKPFAKNCVNAKKQKLVFTGHAQLGSRLVNMLFKNKIPQKYMGSLVWSIDNHMCCCSHQAQFNTINNFKDLLIVSIPNLKYHELSINMICMLFAADNLSRKTDEIINHDLVVKHSIQLRDELIYYVKNTTFSNMVVSIFNKRQITNEKIIVINYGLSGSGKSATSKYINDKLSNKYKIAHIERDSCYYEIANSLGYRVLENTNYMDIYNFVKDKDDCGKVQNLWVTKLNDCLENTENRIIIIDSVQPLYNLAWTSTINNLSEEARLNYTNSFKIGAYLFPINQLSISIEPKTGEFSTLPNDKITYPNVNFELGIFNNLNIDIGTGIIENIPGLIENLLSVTIIPKLPEQKTIVKLIEEHKIIENVISLFPSGLIEQNVEYEDNKIKILNLTYKDGMQIFTGLSRDYRGEVLVFDKQINEWNLLRGSLPVFPDYSTIEKDPGLFPYIYDILEQAMPCRKNWYQSISKIDAKYILTYKHDGSLFNLVFIPINSKLYDLINNSNYLKINHENLIIVNNYGVLFFGSKSRLAASKLNPVRFRIINSIVGSYGSLDNFEESIIKYLKYNNLLDKQITLHFEAIDEIPTSELTVYYGKAFCPFLGYTVFSNLNKKFNLPNYMSEYNLPVNTPMYEFKNWRDIFEFVNSNYQKLLEGDTEIEPEGYVIHVFDNANDKWYPVKLKYEFYYIAHKPNNKRNQEAALQLTENEKFKLLRNRLVKFREKLSFKSCIINSLSEWYNLNFPVNEVNYEDKKKWANYWGKKKLALEEQSIIIYNNIKEHYPNKKIKLFDLLMRCYNPDKNITLDFLIENI